METTQDKKMTAYYVARIILSIYTVWLIYLKIKYRSVLGSVGTSVLIDIF